MASLLCTIAFNRCVLCSIAFNECVLCSIAFNGFVLCSVTFNGCVFTWWELGTEEELKEEEIEWIVRFTRQYLQYHHHSYVSHPHNTHTHTHMCISILTNMYMRLIFNMSF